MNNSCKEYSQIYSNIQIFAKLCKLNIDLNMDLVALSLNQSMRKTSAQRKGKLRHNATQQLLPAEHQSARWELHVLLGGILNSILVQIKCLLH